MVFLEEPGGFYVAVPSAWNDREKVKWCYDERYCERESERYRVVQVERERGRERVV